VKWKNLAKKLPLELLQDPTDEEEEEEPPKRFYGVATGKVIQVVPDPMFLSRVQVQLPWIDDVDLSPFARVAVPMAGPAHGMYFIPNIGDEVLVAFEHGDVNVPYIIGSLWHGMAPPPLPSPLPQVRMIRTLVGNTIMFTEAPPGISILTPTGNAVVLGPPGIGVVIESTTGAAIQVGDTIIGVAPTGVTVTAKNITITATTQLNLAAPKVNIAGATAVNIVGAMVNINS
jgi:Type VI secretion system/phage-baseplate injector OB domain